VRHTPFNLCDLLRLRCSACPVLCIVTRKTYVLGDGSINYGGLLVDIMSGNNTVRGLDLKFNSPFVSSRIFGSALAMQAARAYEEIQNENQKYR